MSSDSKHARWLALVASNAVLVGSIAWALVSFGGSGDERVVLGSGQRTDALMGVDALAQSLVESEPTWGEPEPQGGPNWIFDLFTPPVIYYDEASGSFTVTPPGAAEALVDFFPFVLDSIKQPEYRYQLIAYAGNPGQYLLTLEDRVAGKDIFVAPGETIPGSQIVVTSFEEKRVVPEGLEAGTTEVFDLVGLCLLKDPARGEVELVSGKTAYLDEIRALLRADEGGGNWELSVGEQFDYAGQKFCIQSIDPNLGRVGIRLISEEGEVLQEGSLQSGHQEGSATQATIHSN